jgi:hypothetical protein
MTESVDDPDPVETWRPALVTLTNDVQEMERELLDGFSSRRAVLEWCQRLTIRTLGELDAAFYRDVARQMRGSEQRTLMAALLVVGARSRPLADDRARELRERLHANIIAPAFHRAFRRLRKDAGEYIEETDERTAHDPQTQRWVAMRPALDELETWQQRALAACLDGFEGTGELLAWVETLELATHGEIEEQFSNRCYTEGATRRLLLGETGGQPARELFAAFHLLPRFNAGVRDLSGKAGELPDAEREETEIEYA